VPVIHPAAGLALEDDAEAGCIQENHRFYSRTTVKTSAVLPRGMSENQPRDDGGEFSEKVTEQEILKVFDATDDPFLTTTELAEQLPVSRQAVYHRLGQMREKGVVDKKKTGARGAGWWATVAPRLSSETLDRVESADRDNATTLDDLKQEFESA
jgi:predicted transcriptional regulator